MRAPPALQHVLQIANGLYCNSVTDIDVILVVGGGGEEPEGAQAPSLFFSNNYYCSLLQK